ncbi:MAG TPA: V-type ATP synthase subunit E [Acidimicrobiales bacterium]|nr:V-type ATP synthase subunit E [Acidimicrobiales bacterium]
MTLAFATRARGPAVHAIEEAMRPVAAALIAEAEQRARQIGVAATDDARDVLDVAAREAQDILARARAEGEDAARRTSRAILVDAQQEARRLVLDARRRAYNAVRTEALAELARRSQTPEAVELRSRLAAIARERLGQDASVTTGDDDCGIVAVLGDRRIDLRAPALVDRALRSLGPSVAGLWA